MAVVGIISDTHLPFCRPGYLEFCKDTFRRFKVKQVVHIGDVVDAHALSFHEHDPNGFSAEDEAKQVDEQIKAWKKAFPNLLVCIGNHDLRHYRAARRAGIPDRYVREYADIWNTPRWNWAESHIIDGVLYEHGIGSSGKDAAVNRAIQKRCSIVIGHVHCWGGVKYHTNEFDRIFGLNVGCVDADTEFLSPAGWVRMADYAGGPVMQYSADGTGQWVVPSRYVVLPCDYLNHVDTGYGLSQTFCDDHRVIYLSPTRSGRLLEISGRDLVDRHKRSKGGFQGRFIPQFKSAGGSGLHLSENEIRVQVAYHADGSVYNGGPRGRILVKKDRKKQRCELLLRAAGVPFDRSDYDNGTSSFRFIPPLPTKAYGPEWYQCTPEQLEVVTDEVLRWDGSGNTFDSRHKADCDFVQYAFAGTGRRCSIVQGNGTYRVIVSGRDTVGFYSSTKAPIERVLAPDGKRYCFTVPSGMLVLRHNNCVFITGNCGIDCQSYAAAYAKPFPNRPTLGCGIVIDGREAHFIPMPCSKGERYHRKNK